MPMFAATGVLGQTVVVLFTIGVGTLISVMLKKTGVEFPASVGAMTAAAILRNISDHSKKLDLKLPELSMISNISLLVFLALSMMTMKLWKLIDLALQYVQGYPVYGDLYTQLLQLRFMQEANRTDDEVSELLGLERSTYYDRKKEAILLMGISLWGYVVPTTMSVYRRVELMSVPEEDFFAMVSAEQSKSRSKAT